MRGGIHKWTLGVAIRRVPERGDGTVAGLSWLLQHRKRETANCALIVSLFSIARWRNSCSLARVRALRSGGIGFVRPDQSSSFSLLFLFCPFCPLVVPHLFHPVLSSSSFVFLFLPHPSSCPCLALSFPSYSFFTYTSFNSLPIYWLDLTESLLTYSSSQFMHFPYLTFSTLSIFRILHFQLSFPLTDFSLFISSLFCSLLHSLFFLLTLFTHTLSPLEDRIHRHTAPNMRYSSITSQWGG